MNHNMFAGQDRPCNYFTGEKLPGETPCETDKRKCGKYDPKTDKSYRKPTWNDDNVKQEPCKE